ncbi:MAG: bifunctional precorrin-2 dehydrogenase/sirohydrochlorin ferrochelatase [Acidobacteriota bacterium]
MNYLYPVFLKLENKDCLVIGGGKVAERKILSLIESKARITVISPKVSKNISDLSRKYPVQILKRNYQKGDIKDFFIAIAATDSDSTNRLIAKEAAKYKILCNVVDAPEKCSFFVPSSFHKKDLKIAISTNGKSPSLAKKLREEIQNLINDEVIELLNLLGKLRKKLKKIYPDDEKKREKILESIVNSENILSLTKKDIKKIKNKIKKWI